MTAEQRHVHQDKRPRRILRPMLLYVTPVALALGVLLTFALSAYAVLPRLRISPGFALTNQAGEIVSSEDLRGELVVYSYISAECERQCEAAYELMAELEKDLPRLVDKEGPEVKLVTVVDGTQQPQAVQRVAAGGSSGAWQFLTGSPAQVHAVLNAAFGDQDYALLLVDQSGFVRAEYQALEYQRVRGDLERIIDESRSGGLRGAAYSAAHRFSFTCSSTP